MHFKVHDAPREHWYWLVERLHLYLRTDFRAIEALDSKGEIRGMVGYESWTKNSAETHIAITHPAALLALLGPSMQYPFEQAFGKGIGILYAKVSDDNDKIKVMLSKLGWLMTHRMRGGATKDVDILLFEMRREHWYLMRREKSSLYVAHEGRN